MIIKYNVEGIPVVAQKIIKNFFTKTKKKQYVQQLFTL